VEGELLDVDRRRLLAYVVFALVLGPILISAVPLIAPEERAAAASGEAGEPVKAVRPKILAEGREVESEAGGGEDASEIEGGRSGVAIPLPILWLLNLSIALLIYFIARRLTLGAS